VPLVDSESKSKSVTVSEVAIHTCSVSNRVGTAMTFGINRTVLDPKRPWSPPKFSSNIVMSGCRPVQLMETRVVPEASVMEVCRRS